MMRSLLLSLLGLVMFLGLLLLSCNPEDQIPVEARNFTDLMAMTPDIGGRHLAIPKQDSGSHYGYYLYEPSAYQTDIVPYPLLVYLHGVEGFAHTSTLAGLDSVTTYGPPKAIEAGRWNPAYPMLVVSPQLLYEDLDWQPNKLHEFIQYMEDNYRVNPNRIYITGVNLGGRGVFEYLINLGSRQKAAAVVPIAGKGSYILANSISDLHIWAFHGEEDRVIPLDRGSRSIIDAYNAMNPRHRALLTTYPDAGHDVWTMTYDGSGMGQENISNDRFLESIFDWMLNRSK